MTFNNLIAIIMLIFIVALAVSTVYVSVTLFKELKKEKLAIKSSKQEEADVN